MIPFMHAKLHGFIIGDVDMKWVYKKEVTSLSFGFSCL
jgi:hypothetical protein